MVLASRSNPVNLNLCDDFAFQDGGTAFVDALEKRHSSFGALSMHPCSYRDKILFSRANFYRLFELGIFEKLRIGLLDKELAFLPFSAKTRVLDYDIRTDTM